MIVYFGFNFSSPHALGKTRYKSAKSSIVKHIHASSGHTHKPLAQTVIHLTIQDRAFCDFLK